MYLPKALTFRTMNGEDKVKGACYVNLRILGIERKKRVFVVDRKNFGYDLLIGLDSIIEYKLCQDH